jgi:hypothetical protein
LTHTIAIEAYMGIGVLLVMTMNGFPSQTKSVVVSANTVSRLDFGLGLPPTSLVVTASGAPNPITLGSNLLYTVTLQNTAADAANVQLRCNPDRLTSCGFTRPAHQPVRSPSMTK